MDWKEFINGFFITFTGLFLLFWGLAFYVVGREIYGSDVSLIWAGGILTLISIQMLVSYYLNLWETKK